MASFNWKSEAETEWDKRAVFWNKRSRDMWDNGSRKDILPFMKNYIGEGSKLLDIGCGDGYGTHKLFESGYDATGVDLSQEMIRIANSREKDNIDFLQGDVNKLPFAEHHFDGVLAINVLEWVEDPLHALHEMKRVVNKNGILCVGVLGPTAGPRTNSYPRLLGEKAICNTMMPWEFSQLASDLSLEYVDSYGVYKSEVEERHYHDLPLKLKQSLCFMWVFMMRNVGE
ncbi:class I SAM-dependent methyltransferase [Oceanobacillus polygoni]|uniref:Ubiquinone/menaquinone biosynthesis C-methylase UbiE n=1 Tax=Oceanobacillus polygoni TaxID=1235259 RepID=A0A9X0YWL8_9BACI|nr:class I SAM-dependent methyltransferase [Oceanobacillus polygoni]MBP2079371.1 ubiquinone/menaquinone biosynthesis C-methylase UbiE [Oceanobacillus polygoni]